MVVQAASTSTDTAGSTTTTTISEKAISSTTTTPTPLLSLPCRHHPKENATSIANARESLSLADTPESLADAPPESLGMAWNHLQTPSLADALGNARGPLADARGHHGNALLMPGNQMLGQVIDYAYCLLLIMLILHVTDWQCVHLHCNAPPTTTQNHLRMARESLGNKSQSPTHLLLYM